jgi:hypothetical protein
LDASATVAKSDSLVSVSLREELKLAFDRLQRDQGDSPDWHPGSNDMVLDLVHPSMHPLVYGRTRVLEDEVVGVDDAIYKWAGKGEVLQKQTNGLTWSSSDAAFTASSPWSIPDSYWSDTYQWLPANMAFQDDGSIKFTSYINNLHPNRYPEIYRTIEKLVETVMPAWDQCLTEYKMDKHIGAGRTESRFPVPQNAEYVHYHMEKLKLFVY